MKTVFVVARHTIKPGKLDEFRQIGEAAFAFARDKEPDTHGYRWYFNADQTVCTVIQQYPHAAGLMTHVENMRLVHRSLDAVCETVIEVFGHLTPEIRAALAPFGVAICTPFMALER
jgi:quinol monooxygenase YgiN